MNYSSSRDFFLSIDPENPPSVSEFLEYWHELASENLDAAQWANIFSNTLDLPKIQDRNLRYAFKDELCASHSYRVAYEKICEEEDLSILLPSLRFFSRYYSDQIPQSFYYNVQNILHPELDNQPLKTLAHILGSFDLSKNIPDPDFWDSFQKSWLAQQELATLHQTNHLMQASAHLALKVNPDMLSHFHTFLSEHGDDLFEETRKQCLWSAAVHDCIGGGNTILRAPIARLLTEHWMKDAKTRNAIAGWLDLPLRETDQKSENKRSKEENRLRDLFARAGARIRPIEDRYLPYVAAPVDLRLLFNRHDIIIEVDGPTHFNFDFTDRPHYNGSSVFNSALKAKIAQDSVLLHLDYEFCRALHSRPFDVQTDIARNLLEKALLTPPGDYHLNLRDNVLHLNEMIAHPK